MDERPPAWRAMDPRGSAVIAALAVLLLAVAPGCAHVTVETGVDLGGHFPGPVPGTLSTSGAAGASHPATPRRPADDEEDEMRWTRRELLRAGAAAVPGLGAVASTPWRVPAPDPGSSGPARAVSPAPGPGPSGSAAVRQRPGLVDRARDLAARLPEILDEETVPGLGLGVVQSEGASPPDRETVAGPARRGGGPQARTPRGPALPGGRPQVWTAGIRDADAGTLVRQDTVFEAASLSKPVFAWLVMDLVEAGQLDLDAPLGAVHRPADLADDPRAGRVTPRLVLRHASGLPNWARQEPLAFRAEPGRAFGYSGEAYVWLQRVVETISGEPLEGLARRRVLEPLGMSSSHYVWVPAYDDAAAVGHTDIGTAVRKVRPREANAAASLHTTAGDYARFLAALLRDGSGRAEAVLAPATPVTDDVAWGLGWGLERWRPTSGAADRAFWHWGDNGVFKAFAVGSRERGEALVVLTNGEKGLRVARTVVEALMPGGHPALDLELLDYGEGS